MMREISNIQDGTITLAYGRAPLTMKAPEAPVRILEPNHLPGVPDMEKELDRALSEPIGSPGLKSLVTPSSRVALIISDRTRFVPRREMILSVLKELSGVPDAHITLVVACGNHPPSPIESLGLGDDLTARFTIVVHSSMADDEMITIGITSAGTEVRINRVVAESDVKVAIGQIKPHYFAGYAGGAKSVLPGVSAFSTISANHLMKSKEGARLGAVEGNPVRTDMEEAARQAGTVFILNIVKNPDGEVARAVAGDVVAAHREGVSWARRMCEVPSPKADIVVVSDTLPVSMNLYQASKLLAPAAHVLKPGGAIVLAAECHEGVGPLNIVNHVIYKMGLCQVLPENHRILLVSGMPRERVEETFCEYSPGLDDALKAARAHVTDEGDFIVIPRGGLLVPLPAPA